MKTILICLDKLVEIWHTFLDSLATIGGNIFILFTAWCMTGVLVLHLLHNADVNKDAQQLVLSTFAGLNGAMMYALTQGRKNGAGSNGNGGNGQRSTDPKPPEDPKPEDPKPEVK
jgi:hypothetical protein